MRRDDPVRAASRTDLERFANRVTAGGFLVQRAVGLENQRHCFA
jgi:hypothetical protein